MPRKIYTHVHPDLDACASVWAVRKFVSGYMDAEVVFVPANWDGEGMEDDAIAVDIEAGGKGFKGMREANGVTHSGFMGILKDYADDRSRQAMRALSMYIDYHDSKGTTQEYFHCNAQAASRFDAVSIKTVFKGLATVGLSDQQLMNQMCLIFEGIYNNRMDWLDSVDQAEHAKIVTSGKTRVAVVLNSKGAASTNAVLRTQNVSAVVFQQDNNLGAIRERTLEDATLDHPLVRGLVSGEADEWFFHTAGFLAARGTTKAPVTTAPSKVDPFDLAHAVAHALEDQRIQAEEARPTAQNRPVLERRQASA